MIPTTNHATTKPSPRLETDGESYIIRNVTFPNGKKYDIRIANQDGSGKTIPTDLKAQFLSSKINEIQELAKSILAPDKGQTEIKIHPIAKSAELSCSLRIGQSYHRLDPQMKLHTKIIAEATKLHEAFRATVPTGTPAKDILKVNVIASSPKKPLATPKAAAPKSPSPPLKESYTVRANPRAGNSTEIQVHIAGLTGLQLTDTDLTEIFRRVNLHSLNKPYPIDTSAVIKHKNQLIYRPNHNGTHSARQVAHLDALFDMIEKKGSPTALGAFKTLTVEERMNLRLGAYFLRAGRVDETSHKQPPADDYYTRSAQMYEEHAKQLGVSPATIAWTKKMIVNSCKPLGARDADIDTDPKNKLGYEALTMVHELDLIRCFGTKLTASTITSMRARLVYFVGDQHATKRDHYMDQFMVHARSLCAATGSRSEYHGDPWNKDLFLQCSTDGAHCWKAVKAVPVPVWT